MDTQTIKTNFDLMIRIAEQAGAKFHKAGKGFSSHCPIHGGKNPTAFSVYRAADGVIMYHCFTRSECGSGDIFKLVMKLDNCDYKAALEKLGGDVSKIAFTQRPAPPVQRPDNPPSDIWQARALALIARAERALWDGRGTHALAWLHARGLNDDTIRAARLGYIPGNVTPMRAEAWGTPNDDPRPVYLAPESVLIPGLIAGKVWYLKMRFLHPRDPKNKIMGIRGNKTAALYLADSITQGKPAVICEGEFDALLLRQELEGFASVVTLGSATNELNIATWGLYLLRPSCFLLAYDLDNAGRDGKNKLTWLHDSQVLHIPALKQGDKDLTDFHKSGGNLKSLVESSLREDAPIFVHWTADVSPATIRGQYWENPDHRIEAYYLPAELNQCLDVMRTVIA